MCNNSYFFISEKLGQQSADFFRLVKSGDCFPAVRRDRRVISLFRLYRERNADRVGIPRVKRIGFKIQGKILLFSRLFQNGFKLIDIKYCFIDPVSKKNMIG